MVLIRTIILKLILTICLASSQQVIFIDVTDYGSPTSRVWLTEKQTFSFFIESDVKLEGRIKCKCPMGREIERELKRYDKSLSRDNYYYISSYITVSQDMAGEWTCYVYRKNTSHHRTKKIIMDVRVDVDECSASHGSWPCSHDAMCTNTLGSYKCTCLTGYTGNGIYCQDVDECKASPCSPDASCTNTLGSYKCTRLTGYTGNGLSCQGCVGSTTISIAVIMTMVLTSILHLVVFKVLVQRRYNKPPVVAQGLPTPTVEEPDYETVDSCIDVSQRAPCPLPAEELEENKKYQHYDTPYEWRIWRFGVHPYRPAQPPRRPGSQQIQ